MKLCKDCKHFRMGEKLTPTGFGPMWLNDPKNSTCARTDMVTGQGESGMLCVWERENGDCGAAATHFEERPPTPPPPPPPPPPGERWLFGKSFFSRWMK